jgi:hypothetical protein
VQVGLADASDAVWKMQRERIDEVWDATDGLIDGMCTQEFPFLLFAWDEARCMVRPQTDGPTLKFQQIIEIMSKIASQTKCRIFNIFSGSPSHLDDFTLGTHSHEYVEKCTFERIINIPSVDDHAKSYLEVTLDPKEVGRSKRISQYGRSSWFAYARHGATKEELAELVAYKLTLTLPKNLEHLFRTPEDEKHVAVMTSLLACRLAIHVGSYVSLVRDLVASHLMMPLTLGDNNRQLQAVFPSEPIVAAVASSILAEKGWIQPLETLINLLQHGVVDKGFRGELITKVILCMGMETALQSQTFEDCLPYTSPIPLFEFLTSLLHIQDREGAGETEGGKPDVQTAVAKFQSCLISKHRYNTRSTNKPPQDAPDPVQIALRRLENGMVFFNHFITTDGTLTPALLIQAWNRGAAVVTQPGTKGIDFIIPVILPKDNPEGGEEFGPLFGEWTPEQNKTAASQLSYICIDAKNVAAMSAGPTMAALDKCRPMPNNIQQHVPENRFLSLVLSFGPKSARANHVDIISPTQRELNSKKPLQIKIVARDISHETYPFLREKPALCRLLGQLVHNRLDPSEGRNDNAATRVMMDALPFHHMNKPQSAGGEETEDETSD